MKINNVHLLPTPFFSETSLCSAMSGQMHDYETHVLQNQRHAPLADNRPPNFRIPAALRIAVSQLCNKHLITLLN